MTDERRPWWNPFADRRRADVADVESRAAESKPTREQEEAVRTAVAELRALLRAERGRLRPDTWTCSSDIVERTAELLPHWGELSERRAAEALAVEDVICRDLPRRLEAFLAVPDSQKPSAAPELLEQLIELEEAHLRAVRRLHAISRIRLESLRELRGGD